MEFRGVPWISLDFRGIPGGCLCRSVGSVDRYRRKPTVWWRREKSRLVCRIRSCVGPVLASRCDPKPHSPSSQPPAVALGNTVWAHPWVRAVQNRIRKRIRARQTGLDPTPPTHSWLMLVNFSLVSAYAASAHVAFRTALVVHSTCCLVRVTFACHHPGRYRVSCDDRAPSSKPGFVAICLPGSMA